MSTENEEERRIFAENWANEILQTPHIINDLGSFNNMIRNWTLGIDPYRTEETGELSNGQAIYQREIYEEDDDDIYIK